MMPSLNHSADADPPADGVAAVGLDRSRLELASILDVANEAVIVISRDGRIVAFSGAASRIFRCSAADALGQPIDRFVPERVTDQERSNDLPDRRKPVRTRCTRANGEAFAAEAAAVCIDVGGDAVRVITLRDADEREWAQKVVEMFLDVIEQMADGIFTANRQGVIEYANPAFAESLGYAPNQVVGRTPKLFQSGAHDRRFYEQMWSTLRAGQVFRRVFTDKKADGSLVQLDQAITPRKDATGELTDFVSVTRDVTEQLQAEHVLRRLNEGLEDQARRIAQTLHDEAGQMLTAAHIALSEAEQSALPFAGERIHKAKRHLDQIEEQLRRVAHEIRPRILDDLGLVPALRFLAEGVEKRHGVAITFDAPLPGRLPALVETTVYRLVQEALTNVAKHARATRVTIAVERAAQTLRCRIEDDGVGFEASAVSTRLGEAGFGLTGIRDRLTALGGRMDIDSAPGRGTRLMITIRLED